jgi:hypothetical protein
MQHRHRFKAKDEQEELYFSSHSFPAEGNYQTFYLFLLVGSTQQIQHVRSYLEEY